MIAKLYILLLILSLPALAFNGPQMTDLEARQKYKAQCNQIKKYSIKKSMNVHCYLNYNHYNASASTKFYKRSKALRKQDVKIAEFNMYHPGMKKTRYKDYKKMAQLINKWDVVGATELLALLSDELTHNTNLVNFIENEGPKLIELTNFKIKNLKIELSKKSSQEAKSSTKKNLSKEQDLKKYYKKEIKKAKGHYRKPGYLKILSELHKLRNGKDWALLLSPRGEAKESNHVQELVGYFYRTSVVKPKVNEYCKSVKRSAKGSPIACIAEMGKKILGSDKAHIFSRRPFMAEFISGKFSFILLTSHVVFNSSKDPVVKKNILSQVFGVDSEDELGIGITQDNYARFAEVKTTLDFMNKLRSKYSQKDLIYLGDLNLRADNRFWPKVLNSMPGIEIYNNLPSSISEKRYNKNGEETNGTANDYDHILLDPAETTECISKSGKVEVKVDNFYKGITGRYLKKLYEVRLPEKIDGDYSLNERKYDSLLEKFISPITSGKNITYTLGRRKIKAGGKYVTVKGIIKDQKYMNKYIAEFSNRVLMNQLRDKSYYTYFTEVMSDHMPVVMKCSTN
jgi:hypothetical protein